MLGTDEIPNCGIIGIMAYKDPQDPRSKESKRRHYERNKQRYIDQAKEQKRLLRQFIRDLKESSPCTDCGVSYPYWIMQYDHRDSGKVDSVSRLVLSGSKPKVLAEIEKCDLVCANCHATRTHKRISDSVG